MSKDSVPKEIIGSKIVFFKVVVERLVSGIEPHIFWMKIDNDTCHRFYVDLMKLHWSVCTEKEMKIKVREDFSGGKNYEVLNLIRFYRLKEAILSDLSWKVIKEETDQRGILRICIDDKVEMNVIDYDDMKRQELIVKKWNGV